MDHDLSPEAEALCEAARGMSVDDLEQELSNDPRVQDPRVLAAFLVSKHG